MSVNILIKRTQTVNNPPANGSLAVGEFAIELANPKPRLWVGVTSAIDPTGRRIVTNGIANVSVSDTAPTSPTQGDLWWDSVGGQLYVWFNDGNSTQWVVANGGALADAPNDGTLYGRKSQTWTHITHSDITDWATAAGAYLPLTGGTLSTNGNTTLQVSAPHGSNPQLVLNKAGSTDNNTMYGATAGADRWCLQLGDSGAESGSNAGSNFTLSNYSDAGAYIGQPLIIGRASGYFYIHGNGATVIPAAAGPGGSTSINFSKAGSGTLSNFGAYTNGSLRWSMVLSDNSAESGSNAGSNFALACYSDTGAAIASPLTITRSSGMVNINSGLTVTPGSGTGANVFQISNGFYIGQSTGSNVWIYQPNNVAGNHSFITFHVGGQFACNFGMDGSGQYYKGGWSFGATTYRFWTTQDFTNNPSDYRIKKDVVPLPSMWDRVKSLKPIRYRHKEFTLPNGMKHDFIKNDNVERWGFIAHELQGTLIEDAASGVKDDRDLIQAPTMLPVVAALTKALQEAMARIEALEAKLA